MKKRIVILGIGVMMGSDLNARSEAELAGATRILTIIREPTEYWLPASLRDRDVESLSPLYFNQDSRMDNYLRVAQRIIDVADAGESVAFVTYGSPLVYDRVVSLTRSMAEQRRIPCRVIPNVSSIDAMMAVLGEDIAPGLQICEARWFVANDVKFDVKLPILLFQVGAFWTDGIPSRDEMDPSRILGLKKYLLRHYPENHYAIFVRAPSFAGDGGYARATELRLLDSGGHDDLANTSLYVPALGGCSDASKFWNDTSRDDSSGENEIEWN